MKIKTRLLSRTATALILFCIFQVPAADWPQYRGPSGDGITPEKLATAAWPAQGPAVQWKTETTDGFSSFTVSGGKAFTLVQRNIEGANREVCVALNADTGKEAWAYPLGVAKFQGGGDSGTPDNKGGDGPRTTPAFKDGKVYVLSSRLLLACLDAGTGKEVWTRDIMKEHNGRNISWENAASPVIDGNLIFVCGGGEGESLLGIDAGTGKVVWKGENDKMTHATPVVATIHGQRQVIFFTQSGLVSVKPESGAVLWRHPFKYNVSTAASPIVSGDLVYCSAGYSVGAGLAKIEKDGQGFKATEVWTKKNQLMNHWSTPVVKDGHLYGMFSFKEYGKGPLKCVELATGNEVWSEAGFGPGNVILSGNTLIVLGDAGQLVLAEATPKGYKELARHDVLDGKCWSTPALSGGKIYVRSTKEAVCLDLTKKTASLTGPEAAAR